MNDDEQQGHDRGPGAGVAGAGDIVGYEEAAKILGVAAGTLYAWVSQRRIPHFRVGPRCVRFSRRTLLAFLQARAVGFVDPP